MNYPFRLPLCAPESQRWVEYELLKEEWIRRNPEATPEQYQRAMKAIADRCGV
jgi:hypothetical protein